MLLVLPDVDRQNVQRRLDQRNFPLLQRVFPIQPVAAVAQRIRKLRDSLAGYMQNHRIFPPQLYRKPENQIELKQNDQGEHQHRGDGDIVPFPSAGIFAFQIGSHDVSASFLTRAASSRRAHTGSSARLPLPPVRPRSGPKDRSPQTCTRRCSAARCTSAASPSADP